VLARRRWEAAACAAVLAGLTTEASHAAVDGTATAIADGVHVAAASAWVGGLAATVAALALAKGERWSLAGRIVPRFSRVATVAVGLVLVAGIVNAYLEVRAWRGLWETTYGQLVLVKAALFVPLLGLGLLNKRVSVPGLRLELPSVRRTFVRAASAELALFVVVLGVTAALVQEPPAKTRLALGGPFSATTRIGPYELDLTVDPARIGTNVMHFYVLKPSGQPAYALEGHAFASLPSAGLGPLRFQGAIAGPGHFLFNNVDFPVAGRWSLRVEIRFGSFDQYDTTVNLPISKGSP
jgi:copper transport protein